MQMISDSRLKTRKVAVIAALSGLVFVGGCAGGFRETFGLTKKSPNENLVRVNRPLSLPPDYSLKAPDTSVPAVEAGEQLPPGQNAARTVPAAGTVPAPAPVRQAGGPAVIGQPAPAQPVPVRTAAVSPTAPAAPPAAAPAKPVDVYEQWGVSKTNPDGTPKTDAQLAAELRKKYLEKKKAANPNYGTWKNFLGALFGD